MEENQDPHGAGGKREEEIDSSFYPDKNDIAIPILGFKKRGSFLNGGVSKGRWCYTTSPVALPHNS